MVNFLFKLFCGSNRKYISYKNQIYTSLQLKERSLMGWIILYRDLLVKKFFFQKGNQVVLKSLQRVGNRLKEILLLNLLLVNFFGEALPLTDIFRANDAVSLKEVLEKEKSYLFLKNLCFKQKEQGKIPLACYELGESADFWCLNLTIKELNLADLGSALESSYLSLVCREHLEEKKALLFYRQQDFLLPELKNYWTEQKPLL